MNFEVDIVLALYNGESFLVELLQSIENQTHKNFRLIIRDDQSKDATLQVLYHYMQNSKLNYVVINDDKGNLGVKKNFEALLYHAQAPYIMFADQDDVWFPEKIEKSLEKIKSISIDKVHALVFSDMSVVNESKKIINASYWKYEKLIPGISTNLKSIMLQNVAAGCSMIMTRSLVHISLPFPSGIVMHDWWMMMVASVFGKIDHVNEPLLYYRQHQLNSVGSVGISFFQSIKMALQYKNKINPKLFNTQMQAFNFYERFKKDLTVEQVNLLKGYATIKESFYLKRVFWLAKNKIFKTPLIRLIGLYVFI